MKLQQQNQKAPDGRKECEPVLPIDPGHVRTRQHYTAMLEQLKAEKKKAEQ
jgi:hypothetical protein